jgi:type II secretory pathway pseudopilin PulG
MRSPGNTGNHREFAGASDCRRAGFTIIELLVSAAVIVALLVMTAQMVTQTMKVTNASNKRMDADSMARIAFDRFGLDFSCAMLNNSAAALYHTPMSGARPDPKANSGIGFLTTSRARFISDPDVKNDVRGAVIGYKIQNSGLQLSGAALTHVPVLHRGDARLTFSVTDESRRAGCDVPSILGTKNADDQSVRRLPNDIVENFPHAIGGTDPEAAFLDFQSLGDGIVRLHISFVLDDGRIVQTLQQPSATPPFDATYRDFPATGGLATTGVLPIAFSPETSADANKRYVKGLIVGLAVLDFSTLRQGYLVDENYADSLADELKRPEDGQTPVEAWQANLPNVRFAPVRQNIRFYQRFYGANL